MKFEHKNNTLGDQVIWVEPWGFEITIPKGKTLSIWHKNKEVVDLDMERGKYEGEKEFLEFWFNSISELEYTIEE